MSKAKVWGLPIRVFHILLIGLVSFSWYTAENMHVFTFGPQSGPSLFDLHRWSGYAILALVLARLVWGLMGSTTARFSHFLKGPGTVLTYVKKLLGTSYEPGVGHNPLGGWSVVLILVLLLAQTVTGLLSSEDTFGLEGPLDHLVDKSTSYWLAGIHEIIFDALLIVLGLHVTATLYYLFAKKDNLIVPMITGRKTIEGAETLGFRPAWLALVILAGAAGIVWAALSYL